MRQILKMLRFLLEVIGMDRIRNEWFRGNAGLEVSEIWLRCSGHIQKKKSGYTGK